MIKLISYKLCPFVQRVTASLEIRNIKYEIQYISLKEKPKWFINMSPTNQVPILLTKNLVLFESSAISEYITDEYMELEKNISNEQKALDRAWSELATKNYMPQCGVMSVKTKNLFLELVKKLENLFIKTEQKLLKNTLFFKSNNLSNVDIAWLPFLHRTFLINKYTNYNFFKDFPKMQAWQDNIIKTDILKKTVARDFEQLFKDFYLKNTYLESLLN